MDLDMHICHPRKSQVSGSLWKHTSYVISYNKLAQLLLMRQNRNQVVTEGGMESPLPLTFESKLSTFLNFCIFFIKVQLIYSVVPTSADSVVTCHTHTHIHIFFSHYPPSMFYPK